MPGHRQPSSLESLALGRVCQLLDASCRRLQVLSQESSAAQVLAYAKQNIRPYYAHALSARLRSQVIEETSRMLYGPSADGSTLISGPAPLYLLALLLGHDIRRLRVNLCCYYGCSHQTSLLKLLAQEGAGLESLELARSALLRLDCGLLEAALGSMAHLRRLTLRNIASDAVLQVVGQACPRLLVLDVACSRQVTDAGLRQLLLSVEFRDRAPGESTDRPDLDPHHQHQHQHQPQQQQSAWPRLRGLLAKLRARGPGRRKARQQAQPPAGLLEQRESRRPLCDGLRVLNVANTGVSSAGVLLALVHLPRLESLAEYSHMGRVVEVMKRGVLEPKAPFGLRQARSCRTTPARLELLAQACPRVERLHISEPHHPPEALALFPTLTCLSVHGIPARPDWLAGLYAYLRQHGPRMRELELRLAQPEPAAELELDARELLVCCPRLASLTTDGSSVVWSKGPEPGPLRQLRRAQLGRRCAANAIVRLLSLAPDLGALHVHSCFDLTNEMLVRLLEPPPPPRAQLQVHNGQAHNGQAQHGQALVRNLECFYIYEASKVSASTVLRMLASCRKLRRIGNLANWGLDCDGVRTLRDTLAKANLDVELCPGSHWFWSDCVQ